MLRPLLRGATVVAIPDKASYDPTALVGILASRRITDTLMTPTLLSTVLSRYPNLHERLPELRSLWLNGEVVTSDLCRRAIKALPSTRLLNVYSASETHEVAAGDIRQFIDYDIRVCPVGPPMDPKHVYILDESGNRLGDNETGELYVGGDLLARGYINLPETTAKVFTPDPFTDRPGARMYKTGDLARILPSGMLEITGRAGGMIKTRGYTVQPGAVETAIVKHLAVSDCAVTSHGDGLERQLVAYVVRDVDDKRDRADVVIDDSGYSPAARRALTSHLALYMIPALWVEMDVLPTHGVSGKIDLKSLPPPPTPKAQATGVKSETNTEIKTETIVKLWAEVLNMPASSIREEHGFFDIGGHSLVLAVLANRFTKEFGFPVPLAPLAGTPTLQGHISAIRDARDGHTAAVQADLPAVLAADCRLDDEITSNGTPMRQLSDAETVLLTGATGYLGAFLLKSLIENTTATIVCLVRFTDPTDECRPAGFARIRKNLVDLGLWSDDMLDRMEVLPGNLSGKRLGLSSEMFDGVAKRIDVIIHAAATVNLVYPYAALRNANVGGTNEILRLAAKSGATLHHISTNGVLVPSVEGWSEDAMVEPEDVPDKLLDGYGQTKWVAEKLVCEASRRGMPVKIYRPGTISGHSVSGSTNTYDLLNALIVESLQLGCAPSIEQWFAEMTPADFVTDAIVTLADHTETEQLVYHLGDSNPVSASSLFDTLDALGYPTTRVPWDDWVAMWTERRANGKIKDEPFTIDILRGGMPSVETLQSVTVLKDEKTRAALALYGVYRPEIDGALWETYMRHFFARGWLARPPRRRSSNGRAIKSTVKGMLSGKVAVITGASSGIGAATAQSLAREGAHVVLAARRTDALEGVKRKIDNAAGGNALIHRTDVTSAADVEDLICTTTKQLGPVDILVNCAGSMYLSTTADVPERDRTEDVNCRGLVNCLAATVPGMLSRGAGHIVAISCDAKRKVSPGLGVYSSSKLSIDATIQELRTETAGSGLRVTSIQPGRTDMPEDTGKCAALGGTAVLDADDVAEAIRYAVCQKQHVGVNEILMQPI